MLEEFAADAEYMGQSNENNPAYDQSHYNLCKLGNLYIFDFPLEPQSMIPPMTLKDLNHIIFKKMKAGKACDVYHLTVEHLRYCGESVRQLLLILINLILSNIYFLSCTAIKLGLATTIYKGKHKPIAASRSYRRITVSPILGAIIDYYPLAEEVFRPHQSPDQLGFTAGISYLLAAVQRGECQRWALDKKELSLKYHWMEKLHSHQLKETFKSESFTLLVKEVTS